MRCCRFRLRAGDISVLVIDAIAHCCGEALGVDLLDLILRALGEAPEHLRLVVLELEIDNAFDEGIVTVCLVVIGIDGTVFIQDRNAEPVVRVEILFIFALDLLLDDQALQRPVLDLHGVGIIIDIMAVINA